MRFNEETLFDRLKFHLLHCNWIFGDHYTEKEYFHFHTNCPYTYTNSNLLFVKCNQRSIKDIDIRISVHSNFFPWKEVQCKQRRRGDSENNHKMNISWINDVSNDDRWTCDQKLSSEIEEKIVRKIFKFRNVDCLPINIYRKSKVSNLGDFVRIGRG